MQNYFFRDYPKSKSTNDYEKIRNKIIKYFKNDKNLFSIYEYGQVKAPGISDLDIILVLKKKNKISDTLYDFKNIDRQVNDLVKYGNVIKMDKKTFQYIYYLDKFNLKLLYGKKIKNIYPNKIEDHIITLISIIDWLPERLLRLQFVLQNKSLHISNSLCILNSLCFTLNSISKIIGVNKNINFIIDQTTYFRSHWVKIDSPEKKLIKLIKNSILIGRNAFDEYSNFFKKNIVIKNNIKNLKNEIFYEILKNKFIVFTNDRYKILKSTIFLNQRSSKINIVYISMNFYPHFYELANSGLPLSTVMKRKINPFLSTKIKLKSKYKKLLLNKINLAENNRKFLKLNNFKSGLIRYGYHYE